MAKYAWGKIEYMWERDILTVEQAIGQLIRWEEYNHRVAVQFQRRLESQKRETQMLMEANIRLTMWVEVLEKQARGGNISEE